jgi:hypothetical protein
MSVSAEREGMVIDLIVNEGLPSATVVSRTPVQLPSTATATTVAYSSCGRRSAVGPRSFAPRSSRKPTVPREGFATCVPISPLPSATNDPRARR